MRSFTLCCCAALTALAAVSAAFSQNWVEQGPNSVRNGQQTNITPNNKVNGAISALAINPNNNAEIYVASINGGVWKTTNGASADPSWTPLTDFLPSLSMSDVRFDPTDPTGQTLVASVGRFSSFATVGGSSAGLYRTTDGGSSWTQISGTSGTLLTGRNFRAIQPMGNVILASSNSGGTTGGIFRSADAGATWTRLSGNGASGLPDSSPTYDIVSTNNGSLMFTVVSNTGAGVGGVYRSVNQGATWTRVNNAALDTLFSASTMTNAKLSFGPNDPTSGEPTLFVGLSPSSSGRLGGLFRGTTTSSNPTNWQSLDIAQGGTNLIPNGQGFWHFTIGADPNNNNYVYVGGDVRFSRVNAALASGSQASIFTGADTTNSSTPHVDYRDIHFDSTGSAVVVSDGGIFRRSGAPGQQGGAGGNATIGPGTGVWTTLNGNLRVMEGTNAAYDRVSKSLMAGFQDNGTAVMNPGQDINTPMASKIYDWRIGGDGGYIAIDPLVAGSSAVNTRSYRISSAQNLGSLTRFQFNSSNTQTEQATFNPVVTNTGQTLSVYETNGWPFVAPTDTNKVEGGRLYLGSNRRFYESTNLQAASASSITVRDLTTGLSGGNLGVAVSASAAGGMDPILGSRPNVLFVGGGSRIWGRGAGAAALSDISELTGYNASVNQGVNDLIMNTRDWHQLIVATSSLRVWVGSVAENIGSSAWTDFSGSGASAIFNLANGSLDAIEFVPLLGNTTEGAIVAGTANGVFFTFTNDPLHRWNSLKGTVFPNALVFDLDYDVGDDVLLASTMGRGMWTLSGASIYFSSIPEPSTLALVGAVGLGGFAWRRWRGQQDRLRPARRARSAERILA